MSTITTTTTVASAPISITASNTEAGSPFGSPTSTASSHFTNSTVRLYHASKVLGSDGSLSSTSSNALSRSDSAHFSNDSLSSFTPAPEEGTEAFYEQCHEQFGLPPFADIDILIFGYGSILWKQNFEFTKEHEVYIKDYKRVFFQSSTNHRGTEEHPGRCVTLLPTSYFPPYTEADNDAEKLKSRSSLVREPGLEGSKYENRVYGKAYQLPSDPKKMYEILRSLDTREGGYDCVRAVVYDAHPQNEDVEEVLEVSKTASGAKAKEVVCLCYIATPESEDFVGDAPLTEMAEQMLDAVGFSGPNSDYLFFLEEELKKMGAHDPHVYGLADEARRIREQRERELQFYE